MTKSKILNMRLETAWNMFKSDPKMVTGLNSTEEQLIWMQGFNFACYLLSKED
jgi:hypothetical protein